MCKVTFLSIKKNTISITSITSLTNFYKLSLYFPSLYLNPNTLTFFTLSLQIISNPLFHLNSIIQTKPKSKELSI